MELSLMTTNMLYGIAVKALEEHDLEEALVLYNEMMDLVETSGFDMIDITSLEFDLFGVDTVKEALKKRNLKVSSLIHFDKFASMEEADSAVLIEKAKNVIDLAKEIGTEIVMLVPQAQENVLEYSRKALADCLVKHWIPIAEYARAQGVHVVAEDTPDLRLPLCTTEELSYVLERVPGLEMVYDSGNMILVDEDPVTYFETFANQIAHIHLKDMIVTDDSNMLADTARDGRKMTAAPSGKGLLDFPTLLEHIKNSGYSGRLAIEYAKGNDEDSLESLNHAQKYFEKLL